jgi:hypothetical protein
MIIRLLTGAWCLTGFVLVTAYSSVLISFVTAPDSFYMVLINSVYEMPQKPDVRLTVEKNRFIDVLFRVYF